MANKHPLQEQEPALIDQWQIQERKRKLSHSEIERKRRRRMDQQIQVLKSLLPSCIARNDTEKLAILETAAEYIRNVQHLLVQAQGRDASLVPLVSPFLPVKSAVMALLPNYKPAIGSYSSPHFSVTSEVSVVPRTVSPSLSVGSDVTKSGTRGQHPLMKLAELLN